jgi:hypothetical protein
MTSTANPLIDLCRTYVTFDPYICIHIFDLPNCQVFWMSRACFSVVCAIFLSLAVDTPAADKLCGHYSSYTEGVQHVTCLCDVPFADLDDPDFTCQMLLVDAFFEYTLQILETD